jgi:hypothetical protein
MFVVVIFPEDVATINTPVVDVIVVTGFQWYLRIRHGRVFFCYRDLEGFKNLQGLKLKYYCFTTAFFQIQLQPQFIVVFAVDEVVGELLNFFF